MTTRYAILQMILTPCRWGERGEIQDNYVTWRCVGDTYADSPHAALTLALLHGYPAPVLEKWNDSVHVVKKALGPTARNAGLGGRPTPPAGRSQAPRVLLRH